MDLSDDDAQKKAEHQSKMRRMAASTTSETTGCFYLCCCVSHVWLSRNPWATPRRTSSCLVVFTWFVSIWRTSASKACLPNRAFSRSSYPHCVAAGQEQQPPAVHDLELRFVRFLLVFSTSHHSQTGFERAPPKRKLGAVNLQLSHAPRPFEALIIDYSPVCDFIDANLCC